MPEGTPTKGLFGLPFMQRAMQRKQAEVQAAAEELLGGEAGPLGRMRFETNGWREDDQRCVLMRAVACADTVHDAYM